MSTSDAIEKALDETWNERWRAVGWRCRHGFHSWAFVSMSDRRDISIPMHTAYICKLVERCRRCQLKRTTDGAQIPKRVKR